jgi:hypothetical protein
MLESLLEGSSWLDDEMPIDQPGAAADAAAGAPAEAAHLQGQGQHTMEEAAMLLGSDLHGHAGDPMRWDPTPKGHAPSDDDFEQQLRQLLQQEPMPAGPAPAALAAAAAATSTAAAHSTSRTTARTASRRAARAREQAQLTELEARLNSVSALHNAMLQENFSLKKRMALLSKVVDLREGTLSTLIRARSGAPSTSGATFSPAGTGGAEGQAASTSASPGTTSAAPMPAATAAGSQEDAAPLPGSSRSMPPRSFSEFPSLEVWDAQATSLVR